MSAVPKIGDVLGTYIVRDHLGEGGMGLVYLAEHAKLQRKVALKLLRPELVLDPVAVKRFFAEARAVNAIGHENIVEITDFVDEGEHQYFVMELLKGRGLNEVVKEGPLEVPRAVHIAGQLAMALATAHDAKVVHRDLKPGNVFLIHRGRDSDFVKLLDFGVAKMQETTAEDAIKTQSGMVVGTPAYMGPETLQAPPGDHRVDIYALGVMLFEMTLGYRPFKGNVAELMRQHLFEPPPRPSALAPGYPPALEELILGCMAKDPDDRPASMHEVAASLFRIAEECGPFRADSTEQSGSWAYPGTGGFRVAPLDLVSDADVVPLEAQPAPVDDLFSDGTPHTTADGLEALDEVAVTHQGGNRRTAIAAGVVAALVLAVSAFVALSGDPSTLSPPPTIAAGTVAPQSAADDEATAPSDAGASAEPAAEPLPAVEIEVAEPQLHDVAISSQPEGALVMVSPTTGTDEEQRAGTRRLGVTPLVAPLPEGAPTLVTLRLNGFKPSYTRVTPAPGARVDVALARATKPAQQKKQQQKKPSLKEGAIRNPFGAKKGK